MTKLPESHRLPDRRDDRDAVPARPGPSHRRRVGLHGASAGGAIEAEGLGVHQRAVRQDRVAAAGSGARVLGFAGRSHGGAHPSWPHRRHVQSALRRRDSADDSDARRPGRLSGGRRTPGRALSRPTSTGSAPPPRDSRFGCACSSKSGTTRSSRAFAGSRSSSRSPAARRSFPSSPPPASAATASSTAAEVARRNPEVIFASWCGKKVRKATITGRPGWEGVAAVRDGRIFEVKSTYILQPGPACLTEGVRQLHALLARVHGVPVDDSLAPLEPCDANVGPQPCF